MSSLLDLHSVAALHESLGWHRGQEGAAQRTNVDR
jgi:hypothetical protein